jgi:hypothetical protein
MFYRQTDSPRFTPYYPRVVGYRCHPGVPQIGGGVDIDIYAPANLGYPGVTAVSYHPGVIWGKSG